MKEITLISKSTFLGKEIDVYGNAETPLFLAKDVAASTVDAVQADVLGGKCGVESRVGVGSTFFIEIPAE